MDPEGDKLEGELNVMRWENYFARYLESPVLRWCEGAGCDAA